MDKENHSSLLSRINSPDDLKKLNSGELIKLSGELREFIIDVVSSNPGHPYKGDISCTKMKL